MEESNQKSRIKRAVEYEMSEIHESMGQDGRRKMCKIVNKSEEEKRPKRVESGKKSTWRIHPPWSRLQRLRDSETRTGFLLRFDFHFLHWFMSNNPPTPTFAPHLHFVYLALSTPFHLSISSPLVNSSILLSFHALFFAIPTLSFNLPNTTLPSFHPT
jgi:hypothetical protein